MDSTNPTSYITNDFKAVYNSIDEVVTITANALDEGDEDGQASGVSYVTLKYRNLKDDGDMSEWYTYETSKPPSIQPFKTAKIFDPLTGVCNPISRITFLIEDFFASKKPTRYAAGILDLENDQPYSINSCVVALHITLSPSGK